jgi:tetratricopeptide (TPR) repeat protein
MSAEKIAKFAKLLESSPGNHFARFGLANAYFDEGKFEEAAGEYHKCLEAQDDWMAVHISLGRCLVKLKRYDEARHALETARVLAVRQGHSQPQEEIREILSQIA